MWSVLNTFWSSYLVFWVFDLYTLFALLLMRMILKCEWMILKYVPFIFVSLLNTVLHNPNMMISGLSWCASIASCHGSFHFVRSQVFEWACLPAFTVDIVTAIYKISSPQNLWILYTLDHLWNDIWWLSYRIMRYYLNFTIS